MKKIIYSLLASLFMLASCSQEEFSDRQTDGEKVTVTLATDDEPMSRNGGTGIVDRYIIEVYSDATYGTPVNVFGSTNQATSTDGTFSLTLDRTKEYYCLFWADKKVDGAFVYNATSLQEISVVDGKNPIEASFCGTQAITSKQATYTVTLKRAVGKINLKEKGTLSAGTKLTMTFNQAIFSVATGKATKADAKRTETFTLSAGATGSAETPQVINDREIYTFANNTGNYVTSFTFQCDEEESFDVTNVPLRANFVTNIIGHYTKKTAQAFTITCSDSWNSIDGGDVALSSFANEKTAGIDGSSAEKAYEIANAAQLKLLAMRVNGDDAVSWNTKYYKLTADIDLSTVCGTAKGSWMPIGKSKTLPFKGHFDGNGKTVSNLYIDNKADNQALFGYINLAEVKGITVEGSVKGRLQVAGIVANSTNGTVYNCTNKATIAAELVYATDGSHCAAGVVGMIENASTVSYCTNLGTISQTLTSAYVSNLCTLVSGGVVGYSKTESSVKGCVNIGNVSASSNNGKAQVGGVVGQLNRSTVSGCYNTGDVSHTTSGQSYSGGITGDANVAVLNSNFSTGKVTGSGTVGGILGSCGSQNSETVIFNSNTFLSINGGPTEGIGYVLNNSTKPVINPVADIAAINSGIDAMNNSIRTWNAGNTPSTWPSGSGNKPVAGTSHECKFHFVGGSGSNLPTIAEDAPSN